MNTQPRLYLDDLTLGDEFQSASHRLDVEQIIQFAEQFDPQPFHLDEDAAKQSLFQGLAASGWHTAALTMKLIVASLPLAEGVIGAGVELSWSRPTRPDDVLHVVSKIIAIEPSNSKPDRAIVTFEALTKNQHDQLCQRMIAKVVVSRKPQ